MTRVFVRPRDEAPAIRRAAILLERVREDGGARESEIEPIQAGLGTMQRAAEAGRSIPAAAVVRLEAALDRVSVPVATDGANVHDVVRANAIEETRELLSRLGHSIERGSNVRH
jgi:hypothetical protein